jgi:hypothetical protein
MEIFLDRDWQLVCVRLDEGVYIEVSRTNGGKAYLAQELATCISIEPDEEDLP